jgi:hypothetical protein
VKRLTQNSKVLAIPNFGEAESLNKAPTGLPPTLEPKVTSCWGLSV